MELIKRTNLDISSLLASRSHFSLLRAERATKTDMLAVGIASCGVGFIPFIPATWGSALGVGVYFACAQFVSSSGFGATLSQFIPLYLATVLLSVTGVWAASRTATIFNQEDPRPVIIDEVAGQLVTLLFLPLGAPIWAIVLGFVLFRCFDILKPYPANRLETLRGGFGIMADDLLAGLYAGATLSLIVFLASH
jgi:phosphatidylglycerophosphatase A